MSDSTISVRVQTLTDSFDFSFSPTDSISLLHHQPPFDSNHVFLHDGSLLSENTQFHSLPLKIGDNPNPILAFASSSSFDVSFFKEPVEIPPPRNPLLLPPDLPPVITAVLKRIFAIAECQTAFLDGNPQNCTLKKFDQTCLEINPEKADDWDEIDQLRARVFPRAAHCRPEWDSGLRRFFLNLSEDDQLWTVNIARESSMPQKVLKIFEENGGDRQKTMEMLKRQ
jgi:hypothetical protein